MPWLETNPMDERVRFIVALNGGLYSVAELSERYGVTRQCGDKWRRRYLAEGFSGLAAKSHAPHHCPHRISAEVADALLQLRRGGAPFLVRADTHTLPDDQPSSYLWLMMIRVRAARADAETEEQPPGWNCSSVTDLCLQGYLP